MSDVRAGWSRFGTEKPFELELLRNLGADLHPGLEPGRRIRWQIWATIQETHLEMVQSLHGWIIGGPSATTYSIALA